ncbi:hypothetical protein ANN_13809 [Periplaneta americana]|uniref:Uncharacterized protein n=1 Tax=Periplaneta americana TaxID=6978 RepID=A0ABQ8SVV6_PERAM|nr:hypothetical protein ANN_13809 [Periplaneta americana]
MAKKWAQNKLMKIQCGFVIRIKARSDLRNRTISCFGYHHVSGSRLFVSIRFDSVGNSVYIGHSLSRETNAYVRRSTYSKNLMMGNVPKIHKGKAGTVKPGPDGIVVDELDAWIKAKQLIRPEDQLELSEQELKEEIARVLTTNNPQIPSNIVEFSFKEGCFVPVPPTTQTVLLLDIEGTILHRDSEEARNQLQGIIGIEDEDDKEQRQSVELEEVTLEEEDEEKEKTEAEVKEGEETGAEEDEDKDREEESKEKEKEEGEEGAEDEEGDEGAPKQGLGGSPQLVKAGPKKKLTNQFNFCERATLTYNNAVRSLETQTIPPPRATFSANVTQWIIYDAYQNDFEAQQREKEKEKEKKEKAVPTLKPEVKKKDLALTSDVTNRTLLAVKTLERMINQNTYDDIAQGLDEPKVPYKGNESYRYCESMIMVQLIVTVSLQKNDNRIFRKLLL